MATTYSNANPPNPPLNLDVQTDAGNFASSKITLLNFSAAASAISTLSVTGRKDPSQSEVDEVYAAVAKSVDAEWPSIVNDWNNALSRFVPLIKSVGGDPAAFQNKAAPYLYEVRILYAKLKLECDAGRPWQFPNTTGNGLTGKDITDRIRKAGLALPNHPSFPAGHASEAFTLAKLVVQDYPKLGSPAQTIANEISRRRIIAGVHFKRDISAAQELVAAAFA